MKLYTEDSQIQYFADKHYKGRRKGTSLKERLCGMDKVFTLIDKNDTILDIGCAEGLILNRFGDFTLGKKVGLDLQKLSIKLAKSKFPHLIDDKIISLSIDFSTATASAILKSSTLSDL